MKLSINQRALLCGFFFGLFLSGKSIAQVSTDTGKSVIVTGADQVDKYLDYLKGLLV